MKVCTICKVEKLKSEFNKLRRNKDGLNYMCRECQHLVEKEYYHNKLERSRERNKEKYINNRSWFGKYYKKNRLIILIKKKKAWVDNIEESREKARERKHREYKRNPEKHRAKRISWYRDNTDKVREWKSKPKNRLSNNMSRGIRKSLAKGKDGYKWEKLVGYTLAKLVRHLESLFKDGMTWDNYGKWEIDHIKPISAFDYKSYEDEEFKKCWSLENLQPLWMTENRSKYTKAVK